MCDNLRVIIEASVLRLKRELSSETKELLENDDIKHHLDQSTLDFQVHCIDPHHIYNFSHQFAVLHLTCNNKPEALQKVLDWGNDQSPRLEPVQERSNDYVVRNPVLLAVLQGYDQCTMLLHRYGYDIPKKVVGEGKQPLFPSVAESSAKENQVQTIVDFKGCADPNYLSIAFEENGASLIKGERWSPPPRAESSEKEGEGNDLELVTCNNSVGLDINQELKILQSQDPLRKAFDLAATAESFTNNFTGIVELKQNYGDIKEELEQFTHDLLSQCYNKEEAAVILKHNPEDDDDDDLDPEAQNWQRALWEGRKSFVGHPFYQVYSHKRNIHPF